MLRSEKVPNTHIPRPCSCQPPEANPPRVDLWLDSPPRPLLCPLEACHGHRSVDDLQTRPRERTECWSFWRPPPCSRGSCWWPCLGRTAMLPPEDMQRLSGWCQNRAGSLSDMWSVSVGEWRRCGGDTSMGQDLRSGVCECEGHVALLGGVQDV